MKKMTSSRCLKTRAGWSEFSSSSCQFPPFAEAGCAGALPVPVHADTGNSARAGLSCLSRTGVDPWDRVCVFITPVAERVHCRHNRFMPSDRPADRTPDLFVAPVKTDLPASDPATVAASNQQASAQRYLLPKDLAGSLARLNDEEIDLLFAAVTNEAHRRGRPSKSQPQITAESALQSANLETAAFGLAKGKLNAIRAAFKAGVKPSTIARQFGISQADVRKVLAQDLKHDPRHGSKA
jgi:hypothetical protein